MHGDPIGGLRSDEGARAFPNAHCITGAQEFAAWETTADQGFETKLRPLAADMTPIEEGASIAPGLTGLAAYEHAPGHMVYWLESEGKSLWLAADFANHYVWSRAYPDWEMRLAADKATAAITRRRPSGLLAADHLPFIGYHRPWPRLGCVERHGTSYRYVAASYQLMLQIYGSVGNRLAQSPHARGIR